MRLGGEVRMDVRLVESIVFHALEEKADRCGIGDVQVFCSASAASEEAADASKFVSDDRPRVAFGRKGPRTGVKWEDSPLF
jgi:hypothetical protein